jgi:hypothetical protein
VPFVPAWRAGCRGGPSRLAVNTQKALSLWTMPRCGAIARLRHGARTYRVGPRQIPGWDPVGLDSVVCVPV